VAYRVSS
jgi:hypothetical protein